MEDFEKQMDALELERQKISSEVDFLLFNSINSPLAHSHLISAQINVEEARKLIAALKASMLSNEKPSREHIFWSLEVAEMHIHRAKDQLVKAEEAPWHSLRVTLLLLLVMAVGAAFVFA